MQALIEIQYLPPVSYFCQLVPYDSIMVERHEHYVKQTFRNRCHILTAQGIDRLVVPVTTIRGKTAITDARIDYSQKWLSRHWRAIQSAYGRAPFFEHYESELREELYKKYDFLYDLNMGLLSICLKWLGLAVPIVESEAFEKETSVGRVDLRNRIDPKKTAQMAESFVPAPYVQVFGNKFVPNLSVIDLVFCMGPAAGTIVSSSTLP